MSYAKPWTNDQIDILSSERARARMELLIGVAPLYNIEFFGDKSHGIRCTLYSDNFDISWFSIPAVNIYLSFQYLLVQIVTCTLEPSHEDYEDTQKIKKLLVDSNMNFTEDEAPTLLSEINDYYTNHSDTYIKLTTS